MKTTVSIKLDKEVRDEGRKLAQELGVPFSTLVNVNLKNTIREGKLVLEREPTIKDSVWKELKEIEKDIKAGKNLSPAFSNAKDAIKYLKSL